MFSLLVNNTNARLKKQINGKKIYFLFLSFFCLQNVNGQVNKNVLVGLWQVDKPEETSMNLDTYHFFENNRFVFNPNAYNGLNRIISIVGKYRLIGDTLFLTPDSTQEVIGAI
ncbi:MAG: hypothetical protein WCG87_04950 [Bacteroidota bacterium]